MGEISEYEARITAALERIGRAVAVAEERADAAGDGSGGIASEELEAEVGRLREALEAEQETNSQLEARVRAIHEKQKTHVAGLEGEVERLRRQLMDHDGEMQSLRRVNAQLRDNNNALRAANEAGLADPALVNEALASELESLRVARSADALELDAILTDLKSAAAQAEEA
ncbi:hypothetical protein [Celeribacter arenosi]|uniref:Colicin transporter n=1 Tax=Celeribacter arenosi TaxID=792649 RepID=A0ABP7KBM5_9RHOB